MKIEYQGKTVDLLPCPFCGGEPRIQNFRRHEDWYRIRCVGDCSVHPETYTYRNFEGALAVWNNRPGPEGVSEK